METKRHTHTHIDQTDRQTEEDRESPNPVPRKCLSHQLPACPAVYLSLKRISLKLSSDLELNSSNTVMKEKEHGFVC